MAGIAIHKMFQAFSRLAQGVAVAYDAVSDYMSSENRIAVKDRIRKEMGHQLYNDYNASISSSLTANASASQKKASVDDGTKFHQGERILIRRNDYSLVEWHLIDFIDGNDVYFEDNIAAEFTTATSSLVTTTDGTNQWHYGTYAAPNQQMITGCSLGSVALALGAESPQEWLDCADDYTVSPLAVIITTAGETDGAEFEGRGYGKYALDAGVQYWDALKRLVGTDYFDTYSTYLSGFPKWQAFVSYNEHGVMLGDSSWRVTLNSATPHELTMIYRLAKEYSDGKAQMYADTYCDQNFPQSFYYKDTDLSPTALSGYGNYAFIEPGYWFWKEHWNQPDTGMMIIVRFASSMTHAHNGGGEFQLYDKGKPISGDYGYTGQSAYMYFPLSNIITEGDDLSSGGYTVPGYWQAKENYGGNPVLTRGEILEHTEGTYYGHVRGDMCPTGDPPYNPYNSEAHTSNIGYLSKWIRNVVWLADLRIVVVGDVVASLADGGTLYNFLYHVHDNGSSEDISITPDGDLVTIVKDGGTYTPADVTSKLIMIDPPSADRTVESVGGVVGSSHYLRVYNTAAAAGEVFCNVVFPDSDDYDLHTVTRVSQDNCSGVIITTTASDNKSVVLFSNDGNAVSEYIELGDYYQAADGESYTFAGTTVLAAFSDYVVMRLETGESLRFSDYYENMIIDHMLRNQNFTPPSSISVGLFTASTGLETNSPTAEVSGGAYARQVASLSTAAGGTSSNVSVITFPSATAGWGTINHIAIVDHTSNVTWGTNVNVLMWSALTTPKTVDAGEIVEIGGGNLDVSVT